MRCNGLLFIAIPQKELRQGPFSRTRLPDTFPPPGASLPKNIRSSRRRNRSFRKIFSSCRRQHFSLKIFSSLPLTPVTDEARQRSATAGGRGSGVLGKAPAGKNSIKHGRSLPFGKRQPGKSCFLLKTSDHLAAATALSGKSFLPADVSISP